MNIESFWEYCLSFKGAEDKLPFKKATSEYDSSLMVFSVMDKWFCFVNIDVFDFCNLKCDPDESVELREKYKGITPGYHMNKKKNMRIEEFREMMYAANSCNRSVYALPPEITEK
jgi:predicted DNA-binding protein (MmcQ/YjbR family)